MKITKSQLKRVIKEEIENISVKEPLSLQEAEVLNEGVIGRFALKFIEILQREDVQRALEEVLLPILIRRIESRFGVAAAEEAQEEFRRVRERNPMPQDKQ
tara:strand:- start:311 stop:613 length:303 start_codon:yes stop_codon:yes gene_type:complete